MNIAKNTFIFPIIGGITVYIIRSYFYTASPIPLLHYFIIGFIAVLIAQLLTSFIEYTTKNI